MAKIHIEQATNEQLDYAVAVAQWWAIGYFHGIAMWDVSNNESICAVKDYCPTTNQAQCGELIDEHGIWTAKNPNGQWLAEFFNYSGGNKCRRIAKCNDKSRLIAAVKAFLWSKYPDGMIEVQDANR